MIIIKAKKKKPYFVRALFTFPVLRMDVALLEVYVLSWGCGYIEGKGLVEDTRNAKILYEDN